jgi:FkbM family methyltransferase
MNYSDNGVDLRVSEIFGDFIGHACEVGANDGKFNSNTLMFEEIGWTVLCVEPNPVLAKSGRACRKLWRQVACSDSDSDGAEFGVYRESPSGSSLGVFSRVREGPAPRIMKVKVRTLDRVLEEAGFPRLDFLSIDVEGWEREVMSGFTVERWKPRVIVLEEHTDTPKSVQGYTMIERRLFDNIYERDSA